MEAQTALVRTYSAIELYAITGVYMYLAIVVNPWHAELYHTLWLYQSLYEFCLLKFWVFVVNILDRG